MPREKCWWLICALVLFDAVLSFTIPRGYLLTTIGNITQCLLLAVVLVCLLANSRGADARTRLFWRLMSLGCALWLVAQGLWTYFEVVLRQEVPNPFIGDVILILHLVPFMGALAVRPHVERDGQTIQLGALDFALLVTWWLYLYLFVVIPWQYVTPDEALYGYSFDLVFFLEHFVFVVCAGAIWLGSSGGWRVVYRTLFVAGLVYGLASVASSLAIDFGKYYTGSVYDPPLLVAMACFARVGLVARGQTLRAEPVKEDQRERDLWVSGLAVVTILSLPAMAGWALYYSPAPAPVRSFRLLLTLITMMILGTLTWIKQHRMDKELARANRELREDSLTDVLTGARNRRFLHATIDADVRQVVRSYSPAASSQGKRNRDLVFYIVDTDYFKEVNDRYGHDVGDKLLVEMARRISSAIRHSDALIRWGGDEFLVASRYTDRSDSVALATRVLNFVGREPFEIEGCVSIPCTCSIGWAVFPWFELDTEAIPYTEVLRLADAALYQAKKAGRNQAVGLLPTRNEPASGVKAARGGEHGRLAEQLSARTVTTPGPAPRANAAPGRSPIKVIPATQEL
ncbi:MAG: GGDEF domain-containing protein [Terriglobales bacterium]|jgi:diguanylate cyclase (GGDEF)-like protein